MSEEIHLTRIEWMKGVNFIFASFERAVAADECEELCKAYFEKHREIALPGEALWVDLRPAFAKPLRDVTPKTFFSVPMGYTPPKE
jgi:hypothetical protein